MTIWRYALGSTAVTALVVVQALAVYPNYFAALTAISADSSTRLVLVNQFLVTLWLVGKFILKVTFGELRLAEIEKIYQRGWPFVVDGVMMATSLQSEDSGLSLGFTLSFVGFLLAVHWILHERILVLYQMMEFPSPSRQLRVFLLTATLIWLDTSLFLYMWSQVIRGSTVSLMMCPFFIDMLSISVSSMLRLAIDFAEVYIYLADAEDGDEWEQKPLLLFVTGFFVHTAALVAYAANIYLVGSFSFNLFFGVFGRARKVYILVTEFYHAAQAKRILNSIVNDASEEDISRDNLCVICREEMKTSATDRMKPKRMYCGHVIHFSCLKSWMNRAQHCPTCRQPVKQTTSAFGPNQPQAQAQTQTQTGNLAQPHPQAGAQPLPQGLDRGEPAFAEPIPGLGQAADGPDTSHWHKFATRTNDQTQQINLDGTWYDFQVI